MNNREGTKTLPALFKLCRTRARTPAAGKQQLQRKLFGDKSANEVRDLLK